MCNTGKGITLEGYTHEELVNCAGAGISEHEAMCNEIESLKEKIKLMSDFLTPRELKTIDNILKLQKNQR